MHAICSFSLINQADCPSYYCTGNFKLSLKNVIKFVCFWRRVTIPSLHLLQKFIISIIPTCTLEVQGQIYINEYEN